MQEKEIGILKKLCEKYNTNPEMIQKLIKLEKNYANKNMSRRADISKRLLEIIDSYV